MTLWFATGSWRRNTNSSRSHSQWMLYSARYTRCYTARRSAGAPQIEQAETAALRYYDEYNMHSRRTNRPPTRHRHEGEVDQPPPKFGAYTNSLMIPSASPPW